MKLATGKINSVGINQNTVLAQEEPNDRLLY
jgi:hypothetical protein